MTQKTVDTNQINEHYHNRKTPGCQIIYSMCFSSLKHKRGINILN